MDVHFFIIVSLMLIIIGLLIFFVCGLCFWFIFFHRKRLVQPYCLPSKAELENIQTVRSTTDHLYEEVQNISFEHSQEYIDDNVSVQAEFLSDNVISDNVSHNYDTDSEIENQQINTVADVHEYYVLDHTCSGACNCENFYL